jgi:2-oxoglutarate dehydrogenase E1 component
VTRLLLCSGQFYYTLLRQRAALNAEGVAICRVEQLSPFPYDQVCAELERFPGARVAWVQEEHMNAGAWAYVAPRLENMMRQWTKRTGEHARVTYIGRGPSASPATGTRRTECPGAHQAGGVGG